MTEDQIKHIFSPFAMDQTNELTELREAALQFALLIQQKTPQCREQTHAYNKLRECLGWLREVVETNDIRKV